jgi:hypothetical protein
MIPADSTKIPYAAEQGIFLAEQGIQIPCSAQSRDISRLTRRLSAAASVVMAAAFRNSENAPEWPGDRTFRASPEHIIPARTGGRTY